MIRMVARGDIDVTLSNKQNPPEYRNENNNGEDDAKYNLLFCYAQRGLTHLAVWANPKNWAFETLQLPLQERAPYLMKFHPRV